MAHRQFLRFDSVDGIRILTDVFISVRVSRILQMEFRTRTNRGMKVFLLRSCSYESKFKERFKLLSVESIYSSTDEKIFYFFISRNAPRINYFFRKVNTLLDPMLVLLFNEHVLMITLYFLEMYEIWFYCIFYIRISM